MRAPAPNGGSPPSAAPPGVCGPDVTKQFATMLSKIQADFRMWSREDRERACGRILIPLKMPVWKPGTDLKQFGQSAASIDDWDVYPLFQGTSAWLRDARTLSAGCAIPSSSNPSADDFDDAHEDPMTCSDSVQVAGECWLNGTVNYGTFGIMVRLCKDEFPVKWGLAQQVAESWIRIYKKFGQHPEDAELPIKWFRATFFGGAAGTPPKRSGNRPQCNCKGCALDGSIIGNWDYVWEPVKPRYAWTPRLTFPAPAPPAPVPPSPSPSPGPAKTHIVGPGDTLSKIAQQYYGDPSLWTRVYMANSSLIGPNPNLIFPGQTLVIP
jgi:hypothetical protein